MCGTNICVWEWELRQPSSPYNAIMDSSWQCKKCDKGEGRVEGKETNLGFGALLR